MGADMLSEIGKVVSAITLTAGAAGVTAINGATLDMLGYRSVMCTVTTGPIVTGAVTTVKWQQDSDSAMGSPADLAGTSQTIADTAGGTLVLLDLKNPTERYVRIVVGRGTQNATIAAANYIVYGGRNRPAVQTAPVERFVSPAEGTA